MLFWGVVLVVTDRVHVDGIYLLDYGRVFPRRGLVLGMYPGFERLQSMRFGSELCFLSGCLWVALELLTASTEAIIVDFGMRYSDEQVKGNARSRGLMDSNG